MYIVEHCKDQNNNKYCIKLDDGPIIEAALFLHHNAIHFCIPTQVGCNMKCRHCTTTYAETSYCRNLITDELLEIINLLKKQLKDEDIPYILSFSGHGEPMMNWDNVQKCIISCKELFSDIYVTSIGRNDIMDKILSDYIIHPVFYFSIHGSNDDERAKLIPSVNDDKIASLDRIVEFGNAYSKLGGRVVWNYMLCNINSSEESVNRLIRLCNTVEYSLELRLTKYINIQFDNGIKACKDNVSYKIFNRLSRKLNSNIRIRLSQIEGESMGIACGQLRASMQIS